MSADHNTNDATGFGKFVPGFDFLQSLAKQAASGAAQSIPQLPNLGNWVAPTLNVEELEKRIEELKTVQFWLDQNAHALKATIQALEVQKMTLATLKGMNFSIGDVANALKLKATDTVMESVQKASDKTADVTGGLVDPMQWWGSLTQQFGQIAATAMNDVAKKTAIDLTKSTAKSVAKSVAKGAISTAAGTAKSVGKRMTARTKSSKASTSSIRKTSPRQ
ncbi:MAG TPA: hypothetical protein PKC80_02030 [Burkholderiaceae bacterium]|nr:hypothetical protein [Burkholderiaceae bacterium]